MIHWSHIFTFFFSSRRRHTRLQGDWSSDVCSSDLVTMGIGMALHEQLLYDSRSGVPLNAGYYGARVATHMDAPVVNEIGRASCRERVKNSGGGDRKIRKRDRQKKRYKIKIDDMTDH